MRFRSTHLACLILLLSSLAASDARACSVTQARTPGGVFVRNLLLRAAVEESEPARSEFGSGMSPVFAVSSTPMPRVTSHVQGPVAHAVLIHSVTGSSL